ncbi:cation diffusion facilitator family transporter [Halomonas organivorans]|uniref:Cobalt-zinc-cadmium efflux system protein n=1 Tax=Halomonas organivorans TaxID=257772 RepID=A0A7W5G6W2_9GAMM|nr:cation diffusion facilitator family transporter [Halomonas organivorans]MBB3141906.1 cobalt-zinc-cadmium efflux system protein [Halomonas organivorans]
MAHDHAHGHDHHHHAGADSQRRLGWAIVLTGAFMVAEVAGGILSGSLALLADAGHMLTDTAALALAWFAARLSRRPADHRRTYGYDRVQILAAFVNGLTLIAIVVWIVIEALRRFVSPVTVAGTPMLAIAVLGLVVNLAVFAILHLGDRDNLNIRGAALHVLGDLLGSVAAIVAALVILASGWTPIDPLLSLLVAALILRSAWRLTRESGHILLEGAPESLDVASIERELPERLDAVRDVHHVHAWSLTPGRHLLSLHAALEENADREEALVAIKAVLLERFDVEHATIQLEPHDRCADDVGEASYDGHRH